MRIAKFFLLIIIMIVMTSCMTTRFVQSSDDSYNTESSFRLFNPIGYELIYSPIYGYYYYDSFRTRFLFDDFIYMYYPDFGRYRGRYHWDYFGYQQNHYFDRIDRDRNFVQRYDSPNYSMKRGSNNGGYQRSESRSQSRQVQGSNTMRNQNQGSATRQRNQVNSSSSYQRSRQVQSSPNRSTYQRPSTNSGARQGTQRSSSPSTYQRSPANTQPRNQRSGSYGRQRQQR